MSAVQIESQTLIRLLVQCTVQVWLDNELHGTGFFLAPGVVTTCAHVVAPAMDEADRVSVLWNGASYPVNQIQSVPLVPDCPDPYPYPDTALLSIDIASHPWVDCDQAEPVLFPKPDHLYSTAWSLEFSRDHPRLTPIALVYEGELFDLDQRGDWRLQLREGRISGGMSGAPILNLRTGKVCAMMTRTRDVRTDGGGWAIPFTRHLDLFSDILESVDLPICPIWNQTRQNELSRRFTGIMRPAYRPLPVRDELPPSFLLRTEYAVVPFLGRQDEINDLIRWCESGAQSSVQLVVGPAGAGKTRLAAQLCREMSKRGWTTGFLTQNCKPEHFDQLRETGSPLLAVFDYSDAWLGLEQFLIRLDAPEETAPPTRVMLLARRTGAWWHQLVSANPYITMNATTIRTATSSPGELQEAYIKSAEAFCAHLRTDPIDLNEPGPSLAGQPMLVVHMAALLRVDPHMNERWLSKDRNTPSQASQIIASILDHEEGYWQRSVAAIGQRAPSALLRRAVALASLFGWANEVELAQLLTAVPDLADSSSERRHELARWMMTFYPVEDSLSQDVLQPDVLAERLAVLALVDCPQLLAAVSFAEPDHADRAFAIIDRACRDSNVLRWTFEKVLRSDLRRLGPVVLRIGERSEGPLREEFVRALRTAEVDFHTLDEFLSVIPPRSVHLHEVALAICSRAIELARKDGDILVTAAMLERFANRLSSAGQKKEALARSLEALNLVLEAAQDGDADFATPIISQLLVAAQKARAIRRTTEAIAYLDRAGELARDLFPENPSLYAPQLSYVLSHVTSTRIALGDGAEIDASIQAEWKLFSLMGNLEAASSNALLASQLMQRVSVFQPYIPRSDLLSAVVRAHRIRLDSTAGTDQSDIAQLQAWRSLAVTYRALGCPDEELSAAQKAEDLCRNLAHHDPRSYATDLADVLGFRADHVGRNPESAIDYLKEVLAIRREVFSRDPSSANAHALARALLRLGRKLSDARYHEGAIQVSEEAVSVLEQLAEKLGGSEYLDLAGALRELMMRLVKGRKTHRAAIAAMERRSIYRRLAAIDFSRYGRDYLTASIDSMDAYVAASMTTRLDVTAREVIKLCQRIRGRADRLNLDISKILASAGLALTRAGMFDEAVKLLSDAISVRRERIADGAFGEYAPELVRALGYLADTLIVMKNWRKALEPADEALAISGRLLQEAPRDRPHSKRRSDTEQFYACLVRLHSILQQLARQHEAARIRREGLAALQLLASQGNLAAAKLARKDLPGHDPQNGIRSPYRAV